MSGNSLEASLVVEKNEKTICDTASKMVFKQAGYQMVFFEGQDY